VIILGDDSQLLFEVKISQNSASATQIRRHLRDAHLGKRVIGKIQRPRLVLITPDFQQPTKLEELPAEYKKAVLWVPWVMIINFLSRHLRQRMNSSDRLLKVALLLFLKEHEKISAHLP
jgi:hypothetical protein